MEYERKTIYLSIHIQLYILACQLLLCYLEA